MVSAGASTSTISFQRVLLGRLLFIVVQSFAFFMGVESSHSDTLTGHLKPTLTDGFDKTGLGIILLGGVAVAITQPQDYANREAWYNYQKMSSDTARIGDYLGRGGLGAVVLVTQFIVDRDGKDFEGFSHGISHVEALASTFVATSVLKEVNQRHRPNSENPQSMPSGHTSFVFATATSLSYSYGMAAAIPAYALGLFVAASRWSDDAHWLSDTVAGAAVGIFWGRAASLHHMEILPVAYSDGGGLIWMAQF